MGDHFLYVTRPNAHSTTLGFNVSSPQFFTKPPMGWVSKHQWLVTGYRNLTKPPMDYTRH